MKLQGFVSAGLRRLLNSWAVPLIALLQLALHLWTNAHDSFFRDELYYLAAGQHLGFGFAEYPPLVAVAAAVSRLLLGTTPLAIRVLPALAGVLIVLLAADMVKQMGGGLPAQVLAAIAVALGPVFIASSGLLTVDPFDQMWWALCAWAMVRMIRNQEPRYWLLFGLFAGLGLENKLTMGFYAGALVLGLLLTGQRKLLFNRWLIFGGLIGVVLATPYLIWNLMNGLPTLEYTRGYAGGKTFQATPIEYFFQQVVSTNLFALPLWLGGLYFLFFTKTGKPYRLLGWAYLLLYAFFMLQKAKFYWLAPAYPALFASGAYGLEVLLSQRPRLAWMQPAFVWTLAVSGLLLVPFALPMLSPETFIRYNAMMRGVGQAMKSENLVSSALPQNYADRYGWREMVDAVKVAYAMLTPQEQADTCILTRNYGEAGAVDFYGAELGLPRAISGHNSYYLWGSQGCSGKVIISINYPMQDVVDSFESVTPAPSVKCTYCMPYENNAPILINRGLQVPMEDAWPTTKAFN